MEVAIGQTIWYNGKTYKNRIVTNITKEVPNEKLDLQPSDCLTYGTVTIPVDQQNFVAVKAFTPEGNHWLVIDTI